jgi:hypothetical protein
MKKLVLALFLAIPVLGFSQQANVTVDATVAGTLAVTKAVDLAFGSYAAGTLNITVGNGVTEDFNSQGAATAGEVTISGDDAADVMISFSATLGGYDQVTRVLSLFKDGDNTEPSINVTLAYAFGVDVDNLFTYTPGSDVALSTPDGDGVLRIGGTIANIGSTLGSFENTLVVSVIYN